MGTCIEKISHSCGSRDGCQVFQEEDGTYTAYCFACGKHVPDPYKDRPNYKPVRIRKTQEEIEKELNDISSYRVVDLPNRGLRSSTLDVFGVRIGLSEADGRTPETHHYPYYKDGKLRSYKTRLIEGKKLWSVGDQSDVDFFGWDEAIASGSKKLFITEGEIDAMSLYQIMTDHVKGTQYEKYTPAVVSLPHGAGSAAKDITKLLPKIREFFKDIVLVFDMDDPGKKAAEDVMRILPEALVATLPAKDVNECLVQGRSKACYNACVFNAKTPKNTRIVSVNEVADKARKPVEWGFSWPYKKLTDITRGIRLGETYYLGAGVKMGKSELLNDIAAWCIKEHDWKIFIAKPEEANHRTLQGIVGKVVNKIFHDPKIEFDNEAFDRGLEQVQDKLFMLNLYQELTLEGIKTDVRAAAQEGCKAVFIDPITVLSNGLNAADANTMLQKLAQELAQIAMDLNIVIFMFCHLKAPDAGPPHERGGVVQSYQFAGSRAMMRSAHLMLGLEGNKDPDLDDDERNMRSIVVLENRMSGETGRVPLFYDKHTGAFNEL